MNGSAAEVWVVTRQQRGCHGDAHSDIVGELAEVLHGEVGCSMELTATQEACQLVSVAATAQRRGVLGRPGHTDSVVPQAETPLSSR